MKKLTRVLTLSLFLSVVCLSVSYAGHSSGGSHGYSKCGKSDCSKSSHSGLDEKFFNKAYFMMSNAEDLGLSEAQIERIKDLKIRVKKNLIKRDAEIEIAAVDIKAGLYGHQLDVAALHQLVDQKYDAKRMKAKDLVASFAELKGILSVEQYAKMKELWKK